jgi:hypothetical protein
MCRCTVIVILRWQCQRGRSFLAWMDSHKIELGLRIETEWVSKDLYRPLLNGRSVFPAVVQQSFFSVRTKNRSESLRAIISWFNQYAEWQIYFVMNFRRMNLGAVLTPCFGADECNLPSPQSFDTGKWSISWRQSERCILDIKWLSSDTALQYLHATIQNSPKMNF